MLEKRLLPRLLIINFICRRWPNIVKDKMSLLYRLPGYNNCMLDNQDDLMSMINLTKLLKMGRVDVSVMVIEMESDTSDDESDEDGDCVDATRLMLLPRNINALNGDMRFVVSDKNLKVVLRNSEEHCVGMLLRLDLTLSM